MFWHKKNESSKALKLVADTLSMIEVDISRLKAEVEGIQVKLRKRVYREAENTEEKKVQGFQDGFDELRNI